MSQVLPSTFSSQNKAKLIMGYEPAVELIFIKLRDTISWSFLSSQYEIENVFAAISSLWQTITFWWSDHAFFGEYLKPEKCAWPVGQVPNKPAQQLFYPLGAVSDCSSRCNDTQINSCATCTRWHHVEVGRSRDPPSNCGRRACRYYPPLLTQCIVHSHATRFSSTSSLMMHFLVLIAGVSCLRIVCDTGTWVLWIEDIFCVHASEKFVHYHFA